MGCFDQWTTPLIKQIWVVSSIFLNTIGLGMLLGFTSHFLVDLSAPDSPIKLSLDAKSWLVSSLPFAAIVGFIPVTFYVTMCGRRMAYIVNSFPSIIGLIITIFAGDYTALLLGRIIFGFGAGSATVIGVMVIGEYSSPQYRGMFLNLKTVSITLGILIDHVLGHYFYWRTVAALCLIPFVVSVAICYTWPESPFWLAERKRLKESETTFYWLRGKTDDSTKEIEELLRLQSKNNNTTWERTALEQVILFLGKFKKKNFWKPTIVIIFAAVIIETSGRHIFPSYAAQLLQEMVTSDLNPFYYNVAIDVIITGSSIVASYLITVVNLRTVLFMTGIMSFVILNATCLLLYLISVGVLARDLAWLPLLLFTIFFMFSNLGCSCLPIALMGEIFPLEHRAVGPAVSGCIFSVGMLVTLKIMPLMVAQFAIYGALAVLAGCLAISLIVMYFILPETRNKTLLEIESYFNKNIYSDCELVDDDDNIKSNV